MFMLTSASFALESPRWISQPIYVYIPQFGYFTDLMVKAFKTWESKSDSLVRFQFVDSPRDAQIQVEFLDSVTNCGVEHSVGCTQLATRGRNYYKSVISIATKEYKRIYSDGVYTHQQTYRNKDNIFGVMLHEVGHAVGLGHSSNNTSIMYPYDLQSMQYLTQEDLKLLYSKYH